MHVRFLVKLMGLSGMDIARRPCTITGLPDDTGSLDISLASFEVSCIHRVVACVLYSTFQTFRFILLKTASVGNPGYQEGRGATYRVARWPSSTRTATIKRNTNKKKICPFSYLSCSDLSLCRFPLSRIIFFQFLSLFGIVLF